MEDAVNNSSNADEDDDEAIPSVPCQHYVILLEVLSTVVLSRAPLLIAAVATHGLLSPDGGVTAGPRVRP